MAQLRDKNGKFVRTKPDYKALYESEKERSKGYLEILGRAEKHLAEEKESHRKRIAELEKASELQERMHESEMKLIKEAYLDAVAHMGWIRRKLFGFEGHVS